MDDKVSTAPTPDEVRAQIDRMTASEEFSRSPQLGAFLRFVVEEVLQGKSDRIKAYTIGVDVLRRDAKFDPQLDPIVRVEATRLRRTIDRYYSGLGADDPIRVDLPRGSYIPTFSRSPGAPAPLSWLDRLWLIRWPIAAVVAAIAVAIVVAVAYRLAPTPNVVATVPPVASPTLKPLPPGNGLPVMFMPAFEVNGTPQPGSISARSLQEALSSAFTHFDLVNILLEPKDHTATAGAPAAAEPHADYRFTGSVEYADDGAAHVLFRVIDVGDGSIVWSRSFDRVPAGGDRAAAEKDIARALAGPLLQPFGVVYARQRAKVQSGAVTDPRYRCLVTVIESFNSSDPAQQLRGRDCLEQLTAQDPSFALGFSYLAAVDLREYQYDVAGRPGDAPPLDRGLKAARRGVELNPESARAYEMLFVILFARREIAAAFEAGKKSLELNEYDTRAHAAYGARLIATGDVDSGLAMLRKAGDDGTVLPPFEEFFLFVGEYLRGDMTSAIFHADQITNDSFQLGLVAHALAAAAKGDADGARRAIARLVVLNPAWRADTRGTLARFFYAPSIIDRLAGDLAAAGLGG
jgi:tetratricopeptide (TPR) repeat protein